MTAEVRRDQVIIDPPASLQETLRSLKPVLHRKTYVDFKAELERIAGVGE